MAEIPHLRMRSNLEVIERTKKMTCWHLMSMTEAVLMIVLALIFLFTNVNYYINEDRVLEVCTSSKADDSYPCHLLNLIFTFFVPDRLSSGDYKLSLRILYLTSVICSVYHILTAVAMIIGIASNKKLAMIPWLINQVLVAIVLTAVIVAEVYFNKYDIKDLIYIVNEEHDVGNTRFFLLALALLTYVVFNWITAYMTFNQIKKADKEIEAMNTFQYAKFGHREEHGSG